jgi:naphthoate synthase
MAYEFVIYDKPEDGIARITLNRPESLNAMNRGLIRDVYAAADEAAADESVVVLIYRGAGRAFCSGHDFKESGNLGITDAEWRKGHWNGWGLYTWLYPKATIAEVHGYAVGGGEFLAEFCDITIASEDAKFGHPEMRFWSGSGAGNWIPWNQLIGPKRTKEYWLTGRLISANDAMVAGLVNHVVPRAELEGTTLDLARDIVKIERTQPGYVEANKGQINARHPEMAMAALQHSFHGFRRHAAEDKLKQSSAGAKDKFFKEVDEKGFHATVERRHAGYSSRL